MPPFSGKSEQLNFLTLYNLNTNLWPFTTPNVRTTRRIWKIITFLEFLSQGRRSDIFLNKIEALLIFDPLITQWGHFKASYFKMLNDARVASACLYVRTCQRVRNSKNIGTIRDFQLHVRVNSTIMATKCCFRAFWNHRCSSLNMLRQNESDVWHITFFNVLLLCMGALQLGAG